VINAGPIAMACRRADLGARLWRYRDDPAYPVLCMAWCITLAWEMSADGTGIDAGGGAGDHDHVDVKEASRRSGLSERAVRRAIAEGRLKAHRGGSWCIHSLDLSEFLYRRSVRRLRAEKEQRSA
jgi:excisionase family DNA binding protein